MDKSEDAILDGDCSVSTSDAETSVNVAIENMLRSCAI